MAGRSAAKTSKGVIAKRMGERSEEHAIHSALFEPHLDILALQRAAGNQAVGELFNAESSNDTCSGDNSQGELQASNNKGLKPLPSANASVADAKGLPEKVRAVLTSGGGQPLDPIIRTIMESRFGHDLGDVRVHTDVLAAESARAVGARAYTLGQDVVFGARRYSPGTPEGKRLLAHELAHVVQQSRGGAADGAGAGSPALEQAAERAAREYADAAEGPVQVDGASALGIALQPETDRPTFGNLPLDEPDPTGVRRRVELVQEKGRWYEVRRGGQRFRARGTYDFVRQGSKIWAVKGSAKVGGLNPGHTEAAAGGRVKYAGQVRFSSGAKTRGTLQWWSNSSGHIAPVRNFAEAAGLPMDKFKPVEGGFPQKGPQLPVFQPGAGGQPPVKEPPKVGPGLAGLALGIGFGIGSAIIRQRAIESRAEEEGYVPFGYRGYAHEGRLLGFGRWLQDPTFGADIPLESRFRISPWRQNLRKKANATKPGETLEIVWQVGGKFDWILSRQEIHDVKIIYRKLPRTGIWVNLLAGSDDWPTDAVVKKRPDLNRIIDESISDEEVEQMLGISLRSFSERA